MKNLKSVVAMLVVSAAVSVQSASMTIVQAREKIAEAITNPTTMTEIMKQLSPADQVKFVGEVNAAIATMPGSAEEKAATYLSVSRAALDGASKGNMTAVVAEIFATASVESLTVINERLAADVFNRAANPAVTYTDDQYKKIAANVMATVNERTATADNGDVRSGFAALMLVRASNSSDPAMTESIVAMMPESARESAKNEWMPAALGEGQEKNYESMLGTADAGAEPSSDLVITIAAVQNREAMLSDLAGTATDVVAVPGQQMPVYTAVKNPVNESLPTPAQGGVTAEDRAQMSPNTETLKEYEKEVYEKVVQEAKGYQFQTTK